MCMRLGINQVYDPSAADLAQKLGVGVGNDGDPRITWKIRSVPLKAPRTSVVNPDHSQGHPTPGLVRNSHYSTVSGQWRGSFLPQIHLPAGLYPKSQPLKNYCLDVGFDN